MSNGIILDADDIKKLIAEKFGEEHERWHREHPDFKAEENII